LYAYASLSALLTHSSRQKSWYARRMSCLSVYSRSLLNSAAWTHRERISRHTRSRRVWPSYKVWNGLQSSSCYQLQGRARLKCKAISRNIDFHDPRCSWLGVETWKRVERFTEGTGLKVLLLRGVKEPTRQQTERMSSRWDSHHWRAKRTTSHLLCWRWHQLTKVLKEESNAAVELWLSCSPSRFVPLSQSHILRQTQLQIDRKP